MNTPSPAEEQAAAIRKRHNDAVEFGKGKTSVNAARLWAETIGIDAHKDRRDLLEIVSALNTRIAELEGQVHSLLEAAIGEHEAASLWGEDGPPADPREAYRAGANDFRLFLRDELLPTSAQAHLAELRNAALEEAAQWHDAESERFAAHANAYSAAGHFPGDAAYTAKQHRHCAKAIRALKSPTQS